jgi:hypothetical protein
VIVLAANIAAELIVTVAVGPWLRNKATIAGKVIVTSEIVPGNLIGNNSVRKIRKKKISNSGGSFEGYPPDTIAAPNAANPAKQTARL